MVKAKKYLLVQLARDSNGDSFIQKELSKKMGQFYPQNKGCKSNRLWWLSGLECVSNSRRRSVEDPGLYPGCGHLMEKNSDLKG